MKKIIRFIFSIMLYVSCTVSMAQSYTIKNLGMKDGIPSNYVQDIAQDSKGYIWISTPSGLSRFDGHKFIVYGQDNPEFSQSWQNKLLPNPTGNKIWIATNEGMFYFDYSSEKVKRQELPSDKQRGVITGLTPSTDDGVWITHSSYGVMHFSAQEVKSYTPQNIKGLPSDFNTAIDDGKGYLYIGHNDNGLSVVDMKKHSFKNFKHNPNTQEGLPSNEINVIFIDKSYNIWLGTNKGLVWFNPQKENFTTFRHSEANEKSLLADQVTDIAQMDDGKLWICTYLGGISIFNFQNNTFSSPQEVEFLNISSTNNEYGLSSPNAKGIIQDSFGNIWIANYRGGIDFISYTSPPFKTITHVDTSNSRQIWGLWADNMDKIWLGGEGELKIYDTKKQTWQTVLLNESHLNKRTHINVIHQDKKGDVWLGTHRHGIAIYDQEKGRITCLDETSTKDLDILCFYEDEVGKIWIGTQAGLYSYYENKLIYEKKINSRLRDKWVRGILKDAEGKMWIGANGIFIFNTNKELQDSITHDNGFPIRSVSHLIKDAQNRILTATVDGIIIFKNQRQPREYTFYGTSEGLKNTNVRAIQQDKYGKIWISTNAGISYLDEAKRKFYNYNHHDGIPIGDFMDGATCMTSDGTIYFGSQDGACYFSPNEVTFSRQAIPAVITQFSVYSRQIESKDTELPLSLRDKIKLLYNQNTFKISFNVLDYTQNSQVEFAYMMEGLEDLWYSTQGENQVTFRNIPPGDYTFKVKTRLRNQEWEEKVATLPITISPPFWLAWYAKLLYFFVAAAFVYIVISFYKRKLDLESSLEVERKNSQNKQELNDERLRFYTNITHELRTPLTLILGPLEDLLSDGSLSPKHANRISIIHDSAARLLNLINSILEFRKTETQNRKLSVARGDLSKLVQEIGLRYKELNRNPKVNFHVRIDTEDTLLFFDADMLTTILNNLLSNAAKYTSEGDITLSLNAVEEGGVKYTEISVSDTGHGIAEEALPHIFERYYQANSKYQASGSGIGLALVKGLADLHEATLEVSSRLEEGTTFRLRLLTDNIYPNALHTDKHPSNEETGNTTDNPLPEENTDAEEQAEDSRPLVLVVEDNPDIREYIRQSLSDDFDILTAEDGSEGWTSAQERIPNIIVSDIMMPVMDGIQLCRLVKDDIRTSHIPVILLTAKDSLHDKEEGYTAGADSYLTKPFSAKLLHSRINNLLEMRKKMAASLTAAIPHTEPVAETTESLNPLDNEFLQRITKIIEDNLEMEKMDIAFIADKMCMSHSTLYRKIKGVTDMSANEFIRKVKMKNGVRLLLSERYSISEISYMTGFSSVAYFRQCFKNEFGVAPSEYLKLKK